MIKYYRIFVGASVRMATELFGFLEFLSNFGGAHLMKKNYERVVLTVLAFDAKDVITTSGWFGEPDGPIVLPEDVLG